MTSLVHMKNYSRWLKNKMKKKKSRAREQKRVFISTDYEDG